MKLDGIGIAYPYELTKTQMIKYDPSERENGTELTECLNNYLDRALECYLPWRKPWKDGKSVQNFAYLQLNIKLHELA